MKKVVLVLLLTVVIAAGIFAAGTKDVEAPAAVRNVEFWHTMSGVNGKAVDKLVSMFNEGIGKEKGIVAKAVFQGNDNSEKLKTLAQANDMKNFPDVAQIVGAGISAATSYKSNVPVGKYIEADLLANIEPNMLRSYTYQNQLIGLPFSCSALLLYYNKDLFKQAGISNPPATIAEMAEDISKLMTKDANGKVIRYGLNVAVRRYQLSNFIGGQGQFNFFGDNEGGRLAPMTRVTFGEDGTLRAFLTEWEKVIKTGGFKAYEDDINEEFALQLHAMVLMSTARIGKISALVGDKFDWGVATLPKVNAKDTGGIAVGGSCIVMFDPKKDPKQVEATWEFMKFLVSPEAQFEFHTDTGYIPVNKGVYNMPGIDEHFAKNPAYKVAVDAIHASHPNVQEPFDIINWEIDTIIKDHMLKFANGVETLDQCHDGIVTESNKKLAEYHRANS